MPKKLAKKVALIAPLIVLALISSAYAYVYALYKVSLNVDAIAPECKFEDGANKANDFITVYTKGANATSFAATMKWVPCYRMIFVDFLNITNAGSHNWRIGFRVIGTPTGISQINKLWFKLRLSTSNPGTYFKEWLIVDAHALSESDTGFLSTTLSTTKWVIDIYAQLDEGTSSTWTGSFTIEMYQAYQAGAPTPPAS